MTDLIGQQVGNYRLVALLGQGGFAEVYLGEHVHLGTRAAIKILHDRLMEKELKSFRQEAQLVARLKHPNIIHIFDFGITADGLSFLVMDYLPGGNIFKLYPRGRIVPFSSIVSYTKQAAFALQHAHDARIIHRDVKPENLLLSPNQELILSDFGIAVVAHNNTSMTTQNAYGTIHYMAPEHCKGHPQPASDQYSLAVVVYEWLCGTRPFNGSFFEVFNHQLSTPPPPLRSHVPTIPPPIEEIVLTALAKEPAQRFATVSDFAIALEQACQGTLFSDNTTRAGQPLSPPAPPGAPVMLQAPAAVSEASVSVRNDQRTLQDTPPVPDSLSTSIPSGKNLFPSRTPILDGPHQLKRRVVVAGLGLAGLTVIGGGILWNLSTRQQFLPVNSTFTPRPTNPSSQDPTPTPTPTSSPRLSRGTLLFAYQGTSEVWSLSWSPDDQRIVSGYQDSTIHVWKSKDGGDVSLYQKHTDSVTQVAWSPGPGQAIASISNDGAFRIWNALNHKDLYAFATGVHGHAVAWSPDGKLLATGGDTATVQIWDTSTWKNIYTYQGHTGAIWWISWSPDGQRIASASHDGTVQVWDTTSGAHAYVYRGHRNVVWAVAWSPDGAYLASASWDQTVQVWRASDGTGPLYTYRGHTDIVRDVEWSPDSQRLASAGSNADHTVQVWDALDGGNRYVYSGHTGGLSSVEWSHDGTRIASGGADKTVQIWQAI